MLIYEVSGIFAHKKTIKQFLQPMIEQVWGGGVNVPGGYTTFFRQFFRATVSLCRFFFQFTDAFLGRFYKYLHIFGCKLCAFHQKVKLFWAQNFGDVQLIPNFLIHELYDGFCACHPWDQTLFLQLLQITSYLLVYTLFHDRITHCRDYYKHTLLCLYRLLMFDVKLG